MLLLTKIDSTYKENILAETIKKPRLFTRFAPIYPADWMQVFLYSFFITRGAENNTVREGRHWIPHNDIWNQKCFTGSSPVDIPHVASWFSNIHLINSFVASSKFIAKHSNQRKTTKNRR